MAVRPVWSEALRHHWGDIASSHWISTLDGFEALFGKALLWAVEVPGRVCILGDHSDYVPYLRANIITFASDNQRMRVLVSPRDDGRIRIASSLDGCELTEFDIQEERYDGDWLDGLDERGAPDSHWSNYVRGAVAYTQSLNELRFGFDMFVDSTIPPASGSSSSSALTLCSLLATHLSNGLTWDRENLARMGGSAEWYVGTRGGMMDHATMVYAEDGGMLNLQFNPFGVISIPCVQSEYCWYSKFTHPADKGGPMLAAFNELAFVQQKLIPSTLNEVGFQHPRDRSEWGVVENNLDEYFEHPKMGVLRVRDRFRYVMKEYQRVVDFERALVGSDMSSIGGLLDEAWEDTRDLLGTHTPMMEEEAARLKKIEGVVGVKVLGAGFGGNLLILAKEGVDLGEDVVCQTPGKGVSILDMKESVRPPNTRCAAVLLCGGKGSRMASQGIDVHKPLIPVSGIPSLIHVLNQLDDCEIDFSTRIVVVPPNKVDEYELVLKELRCSVVAQPNALGTGDAVHCAMDEIPDDVDHVYVSFGTQPLVQNDSVLASLKHHIDNDLGFTLPTTITPNPYAPLIRGIDGKVADSVETHLEGVEKPSVGEANIGAYWVSVTALKAVLMPLVESKWNGESYDTTSGELGFPNEMVRACLVAGIGVDGIPCAEPSEMIGIKRIEDVAIVEREYERRARWAAGGQISES
jgi:galactokinase/CTP:molybdopterin cytidylyltransferase MocA